MTARVYLDHAATSPLRPAAREAMLRALEVFGNPSSVHGEGQAARFVLDEARRVVAEAFAVRAERVIFTGGGTEANNLALRGVMARARGQRVLVSAVEHDCVLNTARVLGGELLPVDGNGVVKLDVLAEQLARGDVALVSVMLVNNETGVIQPVGEITALAKKHGAVMHCDAVQAVGHMAVLPDELGVDLLSVSAHKLGGPKGAGALVVRPEVEMVVQMTGGAQERGRRAGTENVPALAGFGAALAEAARPAEWVRLRQMGEVLREGVAGIPGVAVVADGVEKASHILQLRVPGRAGEDLVIGMDMHGVATSQGSACSSGRVKSSHVLQAMGLSEREASEGLRLSWGWSSTADEMAAGAVALRAVVAARVGT